MILDAIYCPFCGSLDLSFVSDIEDGHDHDYVVCNTCSTEGSPAETKEEALSKWNNRFIPDDKVILDKNCSCGSELPTFRPCNICDNDE